MTVPSSVLERFEREDLRAFDDLADALIGEQIDEELFDKPGSDEEKPPDHPGRKRRRI
jgi:hypothetical protein